MEVYSWHNTCNNAIFIFHHEYTKNSINRGITMKKKGVATGQLVLMIILIMSFVGISSLMAQTMNDSNKVSKELQCRMSVMSRAIMKEPLSGTSLVGFKCQTQHKNLGEKNSNTKETIMKDMGDLGISCWSMFGEGMLKSLKGKEDGILTNSLQAINPFKVNEAYCFVCYKAYIDDIEDTTKISKGDMLNFLSNTLYTPKEPEMIELSCNDGVDNDDDGQVDCQGPLSDDDCACDESSCKDDPKRCRLKEELRTPCGKRGGECMETCPALTPMSSYIRLEGDEYTCSENNQECCMPKESIYTYQDYMQKSKNPGSIQLVDSNDEVFNLQEGNEYAIAYVEPFERQKNGFVAIGSYKDIAGSCIEKQ